MLNIEYWVFQLSHKFCAQRKIFPKENLELDITKLCSLGIWESMNVKTSIKCTSYISFGPQLQILNIFHFLPLGRSLQFQSMWVKPKCRAVSLKKTSEGSHYKTCLKSLDTFRPRHSQVCFFFFWCLFHV